MKGKGIWIALYPRQGNWLHIRDTVQIGGIYLKLTELYQSASIRALSICADDTRQWEINTADKVTRFHSYLLHHCGVDDLRVRVEIKKRHHLPVLLR